MRYVKSKKYTFHTQYRPYSAGTIQRGLTQFKKNLNEDYELKEEGAVENDRWTDIQPILSPTAKERFSYPTQKPLTLYERIIKASSNTGDMVLDPFCGCATTLIAAERLERRWTGIDIWNKAQDAVVERLRKEDLLAPAGQPDGKFFHVGEIHYATEPPQRTDDGQEAVPFLKTKLKVDAPKGQKMSRAKMVQFLLEQHGSRCQGCNRVFDDPRYLELDHNTHGRTAD